MKGQAAAISPGAARMRRSRERRRNGIAGCLLVEIKWTEIEALARKGLIREEDRYDYAAVLSGLYRHLDASLAR